MYYGIDIYYLILVVPAIILSMIAQAKVSSTFKKYSQVRSMRGVTGAYAAQAVLNHLIALLYAFSAPLGLL